MLKNYEMQLLERFWNNCVDNAVKALSEMLLKDIKKSKSSIRLKKIGQVPSLMNPKDIETTIVFTIARDGHEFTVIFSTSLKHFLRMADLLLKKEIDYYSALNQENEPIILELGNIMNGYFLSSLNELFDSKMNYEGPTLSTNPFRAVEDFGLGNIYKENFNVLSFSTDFSMKGENIKGKMILLTKEKNLDNLLEAISKKVEVI